MMLKWFDAVMKEYTVNKCEAYASMAEIQLIAVKNPTKSIYYMDLALQQNPPLSIKLLLEYISLSIEDISQNISKSDMIAQYCFERALYKMLNDCNQSMQMLWTEFTQEKICTRIIRLQKSIFISAFHNS